MSRFTVTYTRTALDELAVLWMAAPDRQRIADAANEIDSRLADRPVAQGIELHEGLMQLFVGDIVVKFSVEEQDRTVTIWSARLIREE